MKLVVMKITGCMECPYMPNPHDAPAMCEHPRWGKDPPLILTLFDTPYPNWCPLPDAPELKETM